MESTILAWNQGDLAKQLESGLKNGDLEMGRWVNGRVIGLLASAASSSAAHFAIGVSAIPAGVSTPEHSHAAEEIAMIMSGSGTIVIDDERVAVTQGDVVLTPPNSIHRTEAGADSPMTVFWIYSQSDSALRWLEENPVE